MLYYEKQALKNGFSFVIGVDEAGRGPLAGPVVVAAVYLKTFNFDHRVDDSKKLSAKARLKAFREIEYKGLYGLGIVNEGVIDDIRISKAIKHATDTAINKVTHRIPAKKLFSKNTILLFDGTLSSTLGYPSKEIIGGDSKSISIAAASIVAKVMRDRMMDIYSRIWPQYGFDLHKGYGTRMHIRNIARYGLCPIHRRSFCQNIT